MSTLEGYERGTLAPLIKCIRCDKQARLIVENSLMVGLAGVCTLCVECALELCHELGDSLGAQLIAERMKAL
jgi:hypothetical protein